MKCLRGIVIFDKGDVIRSGDWKLIHGSYVRSIQAIDNPPGSGKLTIRKIEFYKGVDGKKKSRRNGVGYMRERFLQHIVDVEEWTPESQVLVEEKIENKVEEGKEEGAKKEAQTLSWR